MHGWMLMNRGCEMKDHEFTIHCQNTHTQLVNMGCWGLQTNMSTLPNSSINHACKPQQPMLVEVEGLQATYIKIFNLIIVLYCLLLFVFLPSMSQQSHHHSLDSFAKNFFLTSPVLTPRLYLGSSTTYIHDNFPLDESR